VPWGFGGRGNGISLFPRRRATGGPRGGTFHPSGHPGQRRRGSTFLFAGDSPAQLFSSRRSTGQSRLKVNPQWRTTSEKIKITPRTKWQREKKEEKKTKINTKEKHQ